MTFGRSSLKRKATTSFLALVALISFVNPSFSAPNADGVEIFQRTASIGPYPTVILMVGYSKDRSDIERLFDLVVSKAVSTQQNLSASNPSGDVANINANAGGSAVEVSPETISAIDSAIKVSKWSNGAFDITASGAGSYKNIDVSRSSSTVKLTKPDMNIDLEPIAEAHIAEIMIRLIKAAKMNHALVKVGSAFRGIGQSINGPWRIEVQDNAGTFAHRAVNLTVQDSGVATTSANSFRAKPLIDPRNKSQIEPQCRGTVVVTADATTAAGLAQAAMVLGAEEGLKLLSRYSKGLIVDNSGTFLRTPGF